jgi:hypothetical protein
MRDKDGGRPVRRWRRAVPFVMAVLALTISASGSVGSAAAAGKPAGFGALPYNYNLQSRCMSMKVAGHIVFPGDKVTAHTGSGICGAAPKDIGWTWSVGPGPGVKGCGTNATTCSFKAGTPTTGFTTICISGTSSAGPWGSCDYYGVPGKGVGIIDGTITDKDGGPVAGATVTAYGKNSAWTTTGSDGYYAMQVKPGSYRVLPSGGPHGKSAPRYIPNVKDATVADATSATAGFKLEAGVELELRLDKSSVPADGTQVVNGTMTTTEFGKPLPNVAVQLEVMPGETSDQAVTSGPRASVCNNGGRIWPTGNLSDPDGTPVTVTTDSAGHYSLAVTVGTTPGTWTLDAWAKNADGSLSSDTSGASDTKSITFKSLGKTGIPDFVSEFDLTAKSTTALQQISGYPGPAAGTLAQTTATAAGGNRLGGLAYAVVNVKDGQAVLVFSAATPPVLDKQGALPDAFAANADDLVLNPSEWTGAGVPATVTNAASLQSVMAGGFLTRAPTLTQFDAGTGVIGWKTIENNSVVVSSQGFEYLGWGYPGIGEPGACY